MIKLFQTYGINLVLKYFQILQWDSVSISLVLKTFSCRIFIDVHKNIDFLSKRDVFRQILKIDQHYYNNECIFKCIFYDIKF